MGNQEKSSKDESITKDKAAILSLAEEKQEKLTQQQDAEMIQPESVKTKKSSKDASPAEDDAAAKPVAYRRPKKLLKEEEDEAEKVHLKPISREKKTFTSSIECLKKATEEEEERQEMKMKMERPVLLRKTSYTSSLDNIAIGSEEREKVHLSCFSKEMGSNVDLVQVCQEQEEGKHEVKLEFKIEE